MGLIQKYNPLSGNFDLVHSEDSFDNITVVANYSALPAAGTVTDQFYWASASQGTKFIGALWGGVYYPAGMYYSNGVSWEYMDTPAQATQGEVDAGTVTNKFVTPDTLTNATLFQYLDATSSIQTQLNSKIFPIDFGNITNWSVLDATTYYLGLSTAVGLSTNQISFVPLYSGTIIAILTEVFSAGTVGSSEDGVLTLFYNDGANSYEIASDFKFDANRHTTRNFTGLSIAVNTDVSYLKFDAPSYTTNPSAIQLRVTLIIRP